MRILHDHRACNRLRVVNRLIEFLLCNVLNVLVDGQDKVFARFRLLLHVGEPLPPRIDRDEHFPGAPAQFIVEFVLDATLTGVFHANGSHDLRRQITRRIKSLRLFLKMDSLQVERLDALDGLVISLARHPAKSFVIAAVRKHYVMIFASDPRNERNRSGKVFHFGRHGESRINQHRHRQLMSGSVVDHAPLGGKWNLSLLLVLRLLHKAAVAKNLQVDQPPADRHTPK